MQHHDTRTVDGGPAAGETHHPDASHPDGQYSRAAKLFHWVTIPPLGIVLLSGLTIRFTNDVARMPFYTLHESLGLLVLPLALARLAYRLRHPPPAWPAHMSGPARAGADAVHYLLYGILVLQPVVGFVTTNVYGFPQREGTAFLGFVNLPAFMAEAPELALWLHWAHSLTGWLLILLIAAHMGATLYHHAIRRDGTLMRML